MACISYSFKPLCAFGWRKVLALKDAPLPGLRGGIELNLSPYSNSSKKLGAFGWSQERFIRFVVLGEIFGFYLFVASIFFHSFFGSFFICFTLQKIKNKSQSKKIKEKMLQQVCLLLYNYTYWVKDKISQSHSTNGFALYWTSMVPSTSRVFPCSPPPSLSSTTTIQVSNPIFFPISFSFSLFFFFFVPFFRSFFFFFFFRWQFRPS